MTKKFEHSQLVEVRRSEKRGRGGRGVFAKKNIRKGQIIELVPMLVVPKSHLLPLGADQTTRLVSLLSWYVFEWDSQEGVEMTAIALGYGSLYNHSYTPNARYKQAGKDCQKFIAIKNIKKGEEIFINYNGDPTDQTDVGFEVNE